MKISKGLVVVAGLGVFFTLLGLVSIGIGAMYITNAQRISGNPITDATLEPTLGQLLITAKYDLGTDITRESLMGSTEVLVSQGVELSEYTSYMSQDLEHMTVSLYQVTIDDKAVTSPKVSISGPANIQYGVVEGNATPILICFGAGFLSLIIAAFFYVGGFAVFVALPFFKK